MSAHTNLEDYQNPLFYDAEMDRLGVTDDFYLKLAQRFGGAVLELGCGTGRYTIPIAHAGITITGLDIVPQMLAHARSKSADLPIQWVEADARDFHLGKRFRFIFESGAMFCHLETRADYEALLACVREHLEPDGTFAVSSRLIQPGTILTTEGEEDWFSYTASSGETVRMSGVQQYDTLAQVTIETAIRRWTDANGKEQVRVSPLRLRHFSPPELEALLHYNGFQVVEFYGDNDFSPLTATSPNIIYLCQLR
jgi:SAM-dependent methyltransferase